VCRPCPAAREREVGKAKPCCWKIVSEGDKMSGFLVSWPGRAAEENQVGDRARGRAGDRARVSYIGCSRRPLIERHWDKSRESHAGVEAGLEAGVEADGWRQMGGGGEWRLAFLAEGTEGRN
jgi:hypothetical protein